MNHDVAIQHFATSNLAIREWFQRVAFNIKGNSYRLVVAINFHFSILLIIWLGTHKEYNKIDATKVAYEKERYADSSN